MLPTDTHATEINDRNRALNWLLKTFPQTFILTDRKPLKSTILDDILEQNRADMPQKAFLMLALDYYCQWGSYQTALLEETQAIDLQGNPVELISESAKVQAKLFLEKGV